MRRVTVVLLGLAILIFGFGPVYGSDGTAADFLRTQASPRLGAMRTSVAVTPDLFNNPAGLHQLPDGVAGVGYQSGAGDFDNYSVSYRHAILPDMTLAAGLRYFGIEDEERREPVGGQPQFGSSFINSDIAAGLYFSSLTDILELPNPIHYGVGIKGIYSELHDHSASAMAIDLGLLYEIPDSPFRVGLTAHNFGGSLTYINESEDLPAELAIGGAYQTMLYDRQLIVGTDIAWDVHDDFYTYALGFEYNVYGGFDLRAGYSDVTDGDLDSNISAGFGFVYDNITLDYAFTPGDDIDDVNNLFVSFQF